MRVCDRCGAAAGWRVRIHLLKDPDGYSDTPRSETDACDTCAKLIERTAQKPLADLPNPFAGPVSQR